MKIIPKLLSIIVLCMPLSYIYGTQGCVYGQTEESDKKMAEFLNILGWEALCEIKVIAQAYHRGEVSPEDLNTLVERYNKALRVGEAGYTESTAKARLESIYNFLEGNSIYQNIDLIVQEIIQDYLAKGYGNEALAGVVPPQWFVDPKCNITGSLAYEMRKSASTNLAQAAKGFITGFQMSITGNCPKSSDYKKALAAFLHFLDNKYALCVDLAQKTMSPPFDKRVN